MPRTALIPCISLTFLPCPPPPPILYLQWTPVYPSPHKLFIFSGPHPTHSLSSVDPWISLTQQTLYLQWTPVYPSPPKLFIFGGPVYIPHPTNALSSVDPCISLTQQTLSSVDPWISLTPQTLYLQWTPVYISLYYPISVNPCPVQLSPYKPLMAAQYLLMI